MNQYKKVFFFIAHCSLLIPHLFGLDFSFRPRGFVYIPSDSIKTSESHTMYGIGGGGSIGFELDLASVLPNPLGISYTLGAEGGLLFSGIQSETKKNVSIYSFGGGLGLYFFPLSRLFTRIDGAIGAYTPSLDGNSGSTGLYWRGGGELGFRFTPGFILAANGGWRQYHLADNGLFSSGIYTGLTAHITFQAGKKNSEGVNASLDQYEAVYPAFMQLYQKNALGSLVIRNNESAEIRDVRVSFRASVYTASEYPCGTIPFISRRRSVQLPLLVNFSPEILRFTDKGRILGEAVIRYRFLGQERETIRSVILATNSRNMVTEGNAAALAAFISPTSPETVDYGKFIAGLARNDRRIGHNQSFQYAIWLLEGLRAGGVILGSTFANNPENIRDTIVQFPAETLSFRSGSSRDLAMLVVSCLESVGIPAAFVQTENDFLVAVSLNINASAAETLFNGTEKILIMDDGVWLPLSMSFFNEGFTASWNFGVKVLNDTFKSGKEADFIMVEEEWSVYPPAPLPEQGGRAVRTDVNAAAREVNRAMQQYITQEIQPILNKVQTQIGANPTAALYNRLGIVLVRAGQTAEGKASYERAAGMGYVSAMTNRGNLALIERDYATAELWFRQALSRDNKNSAAIRGLEQIAEGR